MRGKELLLAVFLGVLLPGMMLFVAEKILLTKNTIPASETTEWIEETIKPTTPSACLIAVMQDDGTIRNMELEEYLVGVILGEMPLSFDIEALKAQAVVARTYTLRRATVTEKHAESAVCVNPACCQAYSSPEAFAINGGADLHKVKAAVSATAGQVITYNGLLIEATYFSCSGGRTEDAVAVWGEDIPYLQAVDSPGEENATHYIDTVRFTGREFARRLGLSLSGNPAMWLGQATYTDGGGVGTMPIGGVVFKGTELRQKLGLNSTSFTVTVVGDMVEIVTKGFGHRVGMSQYGAEAMAVGGSSYQDILAHYYPGTSLNHYRN